MSDFVVDQTKNEDGHTVLQIENETVSNRNGGLVGKSVADTSLTESIGMDNPVNNDINTTNRLKKSENPSDVTSKTSNIASPSNSSIAMKDHLNTPRTMGAPLKRTGDEADGLTMSFGKRSDGKSRNRAQERLNESLLTAVYEAKFHQDIQKLLDKGAQVNSQCRDTGATPLHLAALNSDKDMTEFLLSKGANTGEKDRGGRQPVHIAAWEGALAVLEMLCTVSPELLESPVRPSADFSLNFPDSWNHKHDQINKYWTVMDAMTPGSTPLHVACQRTKEACVRYLVQAGADTMAEDDKGLYPVDVIGTNVGEDVINRGESDSTEGSLVGIARLLIGQQKRKSENVKTSGKRGWTRLQRLLSADEHEARPVTALHTAVTENNLNLITVLMDEGADVLVWNEQGFTPLHLAVQKKFGDALHLMLRHGDNPERRVVDAVDSQDNALLHWAVAEDWTDGVGLLLDEDADVTQKNSKGRTVFHIVASSGHVKILTELLTLPVIPSIINSVDNECYTPLQRAVENNHEHAVRLLMKNGAKGEVVLPDGLTLLHIASINNSEEILDYLLTFEEVNRMKENKTSIGDGGRTALHIAATQGNRKIVDSLLEHGCDINAHTDGSGSTPLHLASEFDRLDIMRCILDYDKSGETLKAKNKLGWCPLHVAAGHGYEDCIEELLRAGADLTDSVHDEQGSEFTALDIIMTCVHKPEEFFVRILDSYIIVDEKIPVTNPQCKIEVDFDFLLPKESGKQLGVLEVVLNNGSEQLEETFFLHPIVQTFIQLKSKNMFLFFALLFDIFLLLALYLSVIAYHGPFTLRQPIYRYILIGLLTINMLIEVINVVRLQRYYLKDAETWIKWTVYVNIVVIVIFPSDLVLRYNMAFTILLSWTQLLLTIAKYPAWGIYVLMFATVAGTIMKVLVVFSLLLVGFAFSFRALFQEKGPFDSVWSSLVKVIIMVYELDYRGTMEEMKEEGYLFADVTRAFYLFFVFMVSLSLVNLILGLAVNDIANLKKKGRARRLAKQVAFLSGIENLLFSKLLDPLKWVRRHRSVPSCLVVKAGTRLDEGDESSIPRRLKEAIVDKARVVQQSRLTSGQNFSLPIRKISTKSFSSSSNHLYLL